MPNRRLLPDFTVRNANPGVIEPVKTKPSVDIEILSAIAAETMEDSYVYVHCYLDNPTKDMLIRVWKTTYLVDQDSGGRSKLIHAEKISVAPMWTLVPDSGTYSFLLVFEALPKSCKTFELIEHIPQAGGFHVSNIQRSITDVYHINIQ